MVRKIEEKERNYYKCQECGLLYEDRVWAEKCESWCKKNPGSCNLLAVRHSVEKIKTLEDLRKIV